MKQTVQTKANQNATAVSQQNSAGTNGAAIIPPSYGIDFLDSQAEQPNPIINRFGFEHVANSSKPVYRKVNPTTKINGLPVNDEPSLEHEADVMGKKAAQFIHSPKKEELLQKKFYENVAQKMDNTSNNTGLPDSLKTGIENLSGMSMDRVKVHYNSEKPAALNALAYTQGNNIYVGSGQEQYLPHEAWHVVQQNRGISTAGRHPKTSELPVQLATSHSAHFAPSLASIPLITALDGMIPAAEAQAQTDLANPPGGIHTAHQTVYINNPTPMNWGYCVEEQLNPLAIAAGWNTQVVLSNSRPDYGRLIAPNTHLFVDLTSVAQAGPFGSHITGKLQASNNTTGRIWEGADITHSGPPGGPAPILQTNGAVRRKHMRRFQMYQQDFRNGDSDYSPRKSKLRSRYGNVSSNTFTQNWGVNKRRRFSKRAKRAGFR